ncbi:unnamed protein product, partial [Ixodes pacificus]
MLLCSLLHTGALVSNFSASHRRTRSFTASSQLPQEAANTEEHLGSLPRWVLDMSVAYISKVSKVGVGTYCDTDASSVFYGIPLAVHVAGLGDILPSPPTPLLANQRDTRHSVWRKTASLYCPTLGLSKTQRGGRGVHDTGLTHLPTMTTQKEVVFFFFFTSSRSGSCARKVATTTQGGGGGTRGRAGPWRRQMRVWIVGRSPKPRRGTVARGVPRGDTMRRKGNSRTLLQETAQLLRRRETRNCAD